MQIATVAAPRNDRFLSFRGGESGIINLDKVEMTKGERKTMPKGQRKDYSKEFKLAAVMLMKSGTMRPKDVFETLGGIDRQTVYRWIKEYDTYGESAFDEKKAVLPAKEVKELQKENKALKEENEILKKAAAYFAERNKTQ